jgi:hypothetical protein
MYPKVPPVLPGAGFNDFFLDCLSKIFQYQGRVFSGPLFALNIPQYPVSAARFFISPVFPCLSAINLQI